MEGSRFFKNPLFFGIFCAVALTLLPIRSAKAGYFELSGGFSYTSSNYGDGNYDWSRRWTSGVGYHFNDYSELEFDYQDVTNRTNIVNFEDTTFHDQIFSIDWVQAFTPKTFPIQPFVKFGVGQLNRNATGTYSNGTSPPLVYDSVTEVLGAGLRLYLLKNFALRAEATTYLTGGQISTYTQNVSATVGVSFFY